MKKFNRMLAMLLAAALCLSLAACGSTAQPAATEAPAAETAVPETMAPEETEAPVEETPAPTKNPVSWTYTGDKTLPTALACTDEDNYDDGSWAIYMYVCGSNLESQWGCATKNLEQLTWVELPENVEFVIETGGTTEWKNNTISADRIQRWHYGTNGFELVDEQPQSNMGDADTLADFLSYASQNYPADKEAVILWDHGGGSLGGACVDDNYDGDTLSLDEMYDAMTSVFTADVDNPPLEMIGFDACLMSTIDVAYNFCDLAHFLVASEETEPGNGWTYSSWAQDLADNPGMKGKELGIDICDSYLDGCEEQGTAYTSTLACIDLNRIGKLVEAYQSFGKEAIVCAATEQGFAAEFARAANLCENYGGNSPTEGYFNLVDLGALAEENIATLDSAQTIVDELKKCVVHKVGGRARLGGHGLACYYSYNGDTDEMEYYRYLMSLDNDLSSLYEYFATGVLDENAEDILSQANVTAEDMVWIPRATEMGWDGIVPEIDENGNTSINLGPEAADVLTGVFYELYEVWPQNDTICYLGSDDTLYYNWEDGIFGDQFHGSWGQIDGHRVYMNLTDQQDDYDLYAIPIELNGDYRILEVIYDHYKGWDILGSYDPKDEGSQAGKNLTPLVPGDEITTIDYMATISGQDGYDPQDGVTFMVTEDTEFTFSSLGDGIYYLIYEMQDMYYDFARSEAVFFVVEDGHITVTHEDLTES